MMSVNQRISASTFSEGTQVHSYIPPHPAKGTGPHRIVTILLEQATTMKVEEEEEGQFLSGVVSPGHTPQPRRDMTVWSWVKHHALIPRGLHLFYAAWDPSVTHTYSTFLNQRAPEYIEVPKPFSPHTLEDGLDIPRFFNI
ncbi:39S ribosomal protein L38, mitochondrial [Coelomomyces lativittatus]|nr:39S ribosomal protein L38, mitochondrial [Coelomomyces lativittatus]